MDENPYAAPRSATMNEREYRRIVQRRAAVASAIDGAVAAAIITMVPLFIFGLALPTDGVSNPTWLWAVAGLFVYNLVITVTGTSIGGLLTRTREDKQTNLGWLLFVVVFRTFWPLPFAVLGIIGVFYAATLLLAAEMGLRPDVSGVVFAVGPWVLPFFAWFFVRLRRETWALAHTILLTPPKG